MKKVKTLILIAIAVFSLNTVFAQSNSTAKNTKGTKTIKTVAQRAQVYADTLKNVLNLSDDQYSKIVSINTDYLTKKAAFHKTAKTDSTVQAKTQMYQIRKDRNAQIKAVLTPAQQTTWNAWKKSKEKSQTAKSKDLE